MDATSTTRRRLVVTISTLALVAAIAACGGPANLGPSSAAVPSSIPVASTVVPASSPSPTPSQRPEQVLLANLDRRLASALLSIRMTETVSSAVFIDGVAMSPAPPDVVIEYTGEALVVGDDHLARLKADGENDWVVESIRRDGRSSRRFMADGWARSDFEPRLPDILRIIDSLEPLGTMERDGRTLLRYAARTHAPIQLANTWYVDVPGGDPDHGTIEIVATAEGVPIAAIMTIASDDMSIAIPGAPTPEPRNYRVEIVWEDVPSGAAVPDPSEALAPTAVAEHDLTMGLPAGWVLETVDGVWVWFEAPGPDAYVGVARVEAPKSPRNDAPTAQLAAWSLAIIGNAQKELGVEPVMVEAIRAGGVPGRLATYRVPASVDRTAYTQIEAMFVDGTWAYAVKWQSDGALELVARYRFERILESLELSD